MGITVSGRGEASAAPDKVELDVGVSVLASSVAEAAATAAEHSQAVTTALSSGGVAAADVTTTDYTIHPEYDYSGNTQRLTGYRVGNMVRATLKDIHRAGDLLDTISAAGGDHARVNGLNFAVEDTTPMEAEARAAAWNDALAKATQLAELAGRRLGPATSIAETIRGPVAPVRMMADMAMSKEAGTPIQPGSTTVTVNIEVQFDFGPDRA